MTSAEHTAARQFARTQRYDELVFCADPGNMPLSNNRREGLQNRIAEVVAERLGARVVYFWRPFFERGLTRETFDNKECEIIIELPADYQRVLTTIPIYRSTYVFATRADADFTIEGFDDSDLRERRVGVFQHSGMREALSRHGVKDGLDLHVLSYDADLRPEKQPWNQVQKVVDGKLDIAGVWGPFAGWLKAQGAPLTLTPANLMEDQVPLEFDLAFGLQRFDPVLKYALDFALIDAQDDIRAILTEFGVPLVACPQCAVSGDLPAHGTYFENIIERAQDRFIAIAEDQPLSAAATDDQVVTRDELRTALAAGADPRGELAAAVTASDEGRVALLLDFGAEINRRSLQGQPALVTAAFQRDTRMIEFLLARGADPDVTDLAGMTPLHHAVMRNHVPSIKALIVGGADSTRPGPGDQPPLIMALDQSMNWAVKALIEAGTDVNIRFNREQLTPMMVLATRPEMKSRNARVIGGPSMVELGEALIEAGADLDAQTSDGVTALMIAAGFENTDLLALLMRAGADATLKNGQGRTALQVAEAARSIKSAQALRVLSMTSGRKE